MFASILFSRLVHCWHTDVLSFALFSTVSGTYACSWTVLFSNVPSNCRPLIQHRSDDCLNYFCPVKPLFLKIAISQGILLELLISQKLTRLISLIIRPVCWVLQNWGHLKGLPSTSSMWDIVMASPFPFTPCVLIIVWAWNLDSMIPLSHKLNRYVNRLTCASLRGMKSSSPLVAPLSDAVLLGYL